MILFRNTTLAVLSRKQKVMYVTSKKLYNLGFICDRGNANWRWLIALCYSVSSLLWLWGKEFDVI